MASQSTVEVVIKAIIDSLTKDVDKVEGDLKDLGKAAEEAGKGTSKFETAMGGIGKAVGALVASGVILKAADMLLTFMRDSVIEAESAAKAQAQLEAVIASTGGAAGVTAEQVNTLADSLSRTTGVEDDLIIKNAALMLTFTQVSSTVFPEAIEAALNMSAVMGTDLQSSIVQVGKALNDPIEGVTALKRVGVDLDDTQRDLIATMMESGDTMGAQGIILAELNKEFGGAAAAIHDAGVGFDTLSNSAGNLKEALGESLMPAVESTNTALSGLFDQMTYNVQVQNDLRAAEADGIITLEELQTQLHTMSVSSYDASDAAEWLKGKVEANTDSTGIYTDYLVDNWNRLNDTAGAMDNAAGSADTLTPKVANLSAITADYTEKLLFNKLAANLDEAAAIDLAREFGILDERTVFLNKAVDRLTTIYDINKDGVIDASEKTRGYMNAVNDLRTAIENMKSKTIYIDVITRNTTTGVHAPGAGRASGGPVNEGVPYIVGERGPELFVPAQNGTIVPNNSITNFNINLTGTGQAAQDLTSTVRLLEMLYG